MFKLINKFKIISLFQIFKQVFLTKWNENEIIVAQKGS